MKHDDPLPWPVDAQDHPVITPPSGPIQVSPVDIPIITGFDQVPADTQTADDLVELGAAPVQGAAAGVLAAAHETGAGEAKVIATAPIPSTATADPGLFAGLGLGFGVLLLVVAACTLFLRIRTRQAQDTAA